MAGFGIDTSVASFEEVANAIQQQEGEKQITKTMEEALRSFITNSEIENEKVIKTLAEYGYAKLNEIKLKDYKQIQERLEK